MLEQLSKLFDSNEKEIRRLRPRVEQINALEPEVSGLSDAELQAKTGEFRQRLEQGASLDDLLPEAFAVVREASRRVLGMRPFDVQLMGGIVLHEGRIAEMKTGEGKTLAATLPVYLNALAGKGVHVVTVNDYLARRDAEWMGAIYRFLGLSVGTILHGLDFAARRQAYGCDITYGTNNEFGFDYLRDNMVLRQEQMVQRGLEYAIVDEVDSILIDEARTPLIISGPSDESPEWYYRFAQLVPRLKREEDYTVDEKARTVGLTEAGTAKVEKELGVENLFDDVHWELSHYLQQALKAHALFKRDRDYVVKDGEVIIVDEFTGRLMFGRRYSDGLHQAIEAKEKVKIQQESQTLASITFQNYFRMYRKLAGMTGTAKTEEEEFMKIYGMDVVVIPTNAAMIREDHPDAVYKTEKAKFEAVVEEIAEMHETGQPVLVGTISIEKSERLSAMLKRRGVPHQVLNAKYHEKEAEIVAQAGRLGAVTIATNMAGRGTDIMLGGNPDFLARQEMRRHGYEPEMIALAAEKGPVDDPDVAKAREVYGRMYEEIKRQTDEEHRRVVELGGLHIIGTERHESRRIDNQLRGRSGRQGDPGSSRFYVSLEDDLMRLFGSERISGLMERLGWEDDVPIEHRQVSRALENAQKKVESRHFEIRKQVLEYDDVLNQQRELIYEQRRKVLMGESLEETILQFVTDAVKRLVEEYAPEKVHPEEWDLQSLRERYLEIFNRRVAVPDELLAAENREELAERLTEAAQAAYRKRTEELGEATMRELERFLLLRMVDSKWMDHLRNMDDLREGIGLRALGQQHPLIEYRREGFAMFQQMVDSIQEDTVAYLFKVEPVAQPGTAAPWARRPRALDRARAEHPPLAVMSSGQRRAAGGGAPGAAPAAGGGPGGPARPAPVQPRRVQKVGRNDPCPCGSGKKYKKCHGAPGRAAEG
ncbi:preprotein translocase subunit SecA [Limnochorda pilosa]|uniref:Protein translocase subunit SecA n=1 Tax=Limnochorda pilosa TaxID=1555112 RepID=A0A0K2SNT4_LIMPI|nr:preprotein translocase subunit SecA [Limnochorda pilosa]BAS28775.1 preprotein translocase subunit SecA [Limnochorda pilosa]